MHRRFNRSIIQMQERGIVLTKIIHSIGLKDVFVMVGSHGGSDNQGYFYVRNNANGGRDEYGVQSDMTSGDAIEIAKRLSKPRFTQLRNACVDILGQEVWFNKEEPIIVKSFRLNEDGAVIITSEDGLDYNQNTLWRKL